MIREINGSVLIEMFVSGANNLINNRQKVDDMNVFPVPDGDTGTNMSMTIRACVPALKALGSDANVYDVMKNVANDTLRGARGNSGVILSQLMRGMRKAFEGAEVCNVQLLANAFKKASDYAYRAVMKPTEGTILTVAREMGECASQYAGEFDDFEAFLALVTDAGNKALARTPDMLPKLKQAGVVDSGGQGLMYIIEGMYYFVSKGKIIELESNDDTQISSAGVHDEENIKYAYCTECIVDKSDKNVSTFKFKAAIESIGDSMVFVDDDDIVKVHIHTNNPDIVLAQALKIGSLSSVKIENMRKQHSDFIKNGASPSESTLPPVKYACAAVAVGEGIVQTLKDIGITAIIEGGQTMNPSTDDILSVLDSINAENIFVFPNNKNIIMAAQQAKKLCKKNVMVIPTTSVAQSMTCMLEFDEDASPEDNEATLIEAMSNVKSAQVTVAVRDTSVDDIEISEGDYLGIVDGKIKLSDSDLESAVVGCIENMVDEDSAVITVFYGEDVAESDAEKLCARLSEAYDECDVYVHSGRQPVYHYMISVE